VVAKKQFRPEELEQFRKALPHCKITLGDRSLREDQNLFAPLH
jgi:hypothetical protein